MLRETAARWIVRRDRGLTAAETAELEQWLAADPRHAAALARSSRAWDLLDRAPESATVLPRPAAARAARWLQPVAVGLAAALVLGAFAVAKQQRALATARATPPMVLTSAPAPVVPDTQLLPDGTILRLGSDSQVIEEFTPAERRVRLVRGEAYFTVAKDAQRPFLVQAGNVVVRAVGTAFNVQLQAESVEVLVAEGTVQVGRNSAAAPLEPSRATAETPLVDAGHRAVVTPGEFAARATVVVSALPPEELAEALAQRERMLRLSGATLAELAAEFARRNGTSVVIRDPALADLRIGGRFRADDLEGFVRVLANSYGIRSERLPDGAIALGRAR